MVVVVAACPLEEVVAEVVKHLGAAIRIVRVYEVEDRRAGGLRYLDQAVVDVLLGGEAPRSRRVEELLDLG